MKHLLEPAQPLKLVIVQFIGIEIGVTPNDQARELLRELLETLALGCTSHGFGDHLLQPSVYTREVSVGELEDKLDRPREAAEALVFASLSDNWAICILR